ncbi:MAG: hypothetical protein FWC89_01570, partial [Defluviitaleaceae bacterium]|nr:hypothetical protein [Defluviitaleaceae bacterium]
DGAMREPYTLKGVSTVQGEVCANLLPKVIRRHFPTPLLKESFSLFKGGSLSFLDEELLGEVTDILSAEITETSTKKAYADNAFKLSTNIGVHSEWEAHISEDDMLRFGSYNFDLSRMHKIPFTTVIITTKKPAITSYKNPSILFTPKIINLKERDADKLLTEIEQKLSEGEHDSINELALIYLPLYGSKSGKTTVELLDTAIKLTPRVAKDDIKKRRKLQDLIILLASSFVSDEERNKIWEANMRILEDNPAVIWLKDRGRDEGRIEIAINMIHDGDDVHKISRITGLESSRIFELKNELQTSG